MKKYNPWKVDSVEAFRYLKCPECDFETQETLDFKNHAIKNHPMSKFGLFRPDVYECEICEYSCKTLPKFKAHILAKHGFPCTECEKSFITELCLQKHFISVHKEVHEEKEDISTVHEVKKGHQCPECGKSFVSKRALKNHIKMIHKKNQPIKCSICGYSSKNLPEFKAHISAKHGYNRYPCTECEKCFISELRLQKHFISVHKEVHEEKEDISIVQKVKKVHQCPECGKSFVSKRALNNHIKMIHKKNKPIKCSICGYSCKNLPELKAHISAKHGYNGYPCTECEKSFISELHLQKHFISVHKEVHEEKEDISIVHMVKKVHQCPECGKSFGFKHTMDNHIRMVHKKK